MASGRWETEEPAEILALDPAQGDNISDFKGTQTQSVSPQAIC